MLTIGQTPVLDFEVKLAYGSEVQLKPFASLVEGPTLVSVFMRANTGSCDKQMISLGDSQDAIEKLGFSIVGVSRDTAPALGRYGEKHKLRFPLVSDPEFKFATAMDSMVEKKMYGRTFKGPMRSAYVFDGALIGLIASVDPANHGKEVENLLSQLRKG